MCCPVRFHRAFHSFQADLKCDGGLARAGGHRDEELVPALQDRLDHAIDGDLPAVALAFVHDVIVGR